MGTYVRIINDVDAARMAIFPVNFVPNVGYIRRKTKEADTYSIECVQRLMCPRSTLQGCKYEWCAYLTVDAALQSEGDDPAHNSVSGTRG